MLGFTQAARLAICVYALAQSVTAYSSQPDEVCAEYDYVRSGFPTV